MITFEEEARKAVKCDQCIERLDRGDLPACVLACPTRALVFRTLDEAVGGKREGFLVKIACSGDESK
jgi:anaerobic dimethyl sulfoxide reductase subunit B (iron-sulfur subunit)